MASRMVYTGSKFILNETVNAPNLFTMSIVTKKAKEVQRIPKKRSQPKSEDVMLNTVASNLPVKIRKIEIPKNPIVSS